MNTSIMKVEDFIPLPYREAHFQGVWGEGLRVPQSSRLLLETFSPSPNPSLKGRGITRTRCVALLLLCIAGLFSDIGVALAANSTTSDQAVDAAIDRAVEQVAPRVVQLRYFGGGDDSLGVAAVPVTGYALDEHWVVTSTYGLQQDPAGVLCCFADGAQSQARIVARDHNRQIALIGVDVNASSKPPVLKGRASRVGETAIALGRVYDTDSVNVTVGVVSAVGRLGSRAVQTDALVSPVNYGGPLIGLDGQLLGVITPLGPPGQSGVGLYDSGVGFAAAYDAVAPRLAPLASGRDLHPAWLGVTLPNDDSLRAAPKLSRVAKGGPAEVAGLAAEDTITSVDGVKVDTIWSLRRQMSGLDADADVEFTVQRKAEGDEAAAELRRVVHLGLKPAEEESKDPYHPDGMKKPDEP
jgi:serine protease Do